jgi:copper chaperone
VSANDGHHLEFTVAGITCSGCVTGIRLGLLGLREVATVELDVASGRVQVHGSGLDEDRIRAQLGWLGFPPTSEATGGAMSTR